MSIKLNKQTHEKEQICTLIKQSLMNADYELECIIGGNYKLGSGISSQQFQKILSRINNKKEYQAKNPEDKLIINFPMDTKFNNIRVIINGFGSINHYCMSEKLDSIIHNVVFEEKRFVPEKINRLKVPEYTLRFNQKSERIMEPDTAIIRELLRDWREIPKVFRYKKLHRYYTMPDRMFSIDCSIVRSSGVEYREMSVRDVLDQDLIQNVIKPTDEKEPFSVWWKTQIRNPGALVRVSDVNIHYKTLKESRVFENDYQYEVEIEYHNDTTTQSEGRLPKTIRQEYVDAKEKDAFVLGIFAKFFKQIGMILQCVQDSFYLISNTESIDAIAEYVKLTGVRANSGMENLFFGPLPTELDNNKLIEFPAHAYDDMNVAYENGNIILDYCVTEKSDGFRNLLFVNSVGRCFLVSRDSMNPIRFMGISIPEYSNSVFDGEFIENDLKGEFLNKFYMFDAYFVKGRNIMRQPFGRGREPGGRLYELNRFAEVFQTGTGVMLNDMELAKMPAGSTRYMFRIERKTFLFGESSKTPSNLRATDMIFNQCAVLLNKMNTEYGGYLEEGHMFSYKTDGLILTPVELGVFQTRLTDNIPAHILSSSRSWSLVYKWKALNQLSIDFRVEFHKDMKTNDLITVYIGSQKYVRCQLLCRNYDSHIWADKNGVAAGKRSGQQKWLNASLQLNDNMSLYNLPEEIPFKPAYPFVGARDMDGNIQIMSHECLLPMSANSGIKCLNGDIIFNGCVAEFTYDPSPDAKYENEAMRWQPHKVRFGKAPNALNTCLGIWNLIHSPVSRETMTEGLTLERAAKIKNINYFLTGRFALTTCIKKFNRFVINWALERYMSQLTTPRVLDIACGKMADYFKYAKLGAGTVVGLEYNPDNLTNPVDGAAARILNGVGDNPRIKALAAKTLLIQGDMTKNMADGSAATDELGRYYLDILYGRHRPSTNFNAKHAKFYNLGTDGFNLAVCNYAIHYAMGNFQDIGSFFENVGQNLRPQGYFIGTCLDGNMILEELNNSGGYIEGRVNGNIVWFINGRQTLVGSGATLYEENGQTLSNMPITKYTTKEPQLIGPGCAIESYFETFNTISRENLVDIRYLEHIARDYGLKLVDTRTFLESPGNLLSEWEATYDPAKKPRPGVAKGGDDADTQTVAQMVSEIRKEKALNTWSKFQRYFVFQKLAANE
jgi:SAM-dependent methyltransferase